MDLKPNVRDQSDVRLSPFVALQHRDFRLLWFGQLISEAGTQMQLVAINWHIYLLTGSAVALGLVGLTRVIPTIAFSLIGGVIADVHDRRRMMLITQSTSLFFAAVLGLLTQTGWISVGSIYLLSFLTGTAVAFDSPPKQSITPNLVPREHLTNALSLSNIMLRTASIAGPGIAGFIIAWLGVGVTYWINALSFLAVLVALALIRVPTQQKLGVTSITLSTLKEGIRFVRSSHILLSTILLDFFAAFFGTTTALIPIFATEILLVGPQGFGILNAGSSVGALIAGVWMSFAGDVKNKGKVLLWSVLIFGVANVAYGTSRLFVLSVLCLVLAGAVNTISVILRQNIRQMVTPDQLRGRANSVHTLFASSGHQLGNFEAGMVAALIGAPLSVIIGGVATVITVVFVTWWVPQLKHYRD